MKTRLTNALLFALLGTLVSASAALGSTINFVGPFSGTESETWESFNNYLQGPYYLSDPTTIMGGGAMIYNARMVIYQPDCAGAFFALGTSGPAQVSDGEKGMGINDIYNPPNGSTTTIVFNTPVLDFGAYWGEITGYGFPDPNTVSLNFYDGALNLIGNESFTYSRSAYGDGLLEWEGWSSSTAVKEITYSGDYIVIDGLQATQTPEPGSLMLLGTGLVSVIGFARSRLSR
jgi:hypothetical protein